MKIHAIGIDLWNICLHRRLAATYLLASLAMLWAVSVPAHAQVAGATLSGNVTDATGAVILDANISIKNVANGVLRKIAVNSAGFYTAPNLLAGDYEVTIVANGFKTEIQRVLHLTVGSQQILNVEMKLGAVTEQVEVTSLAPAVQLGTSSLTTIVESKTIRELPLNGRSWTDLAILQPGVNAIQTQMPFTRVERGNRGFGDEIAINGTRHQQNNYRLDGVSINDGDNGGPGSVLGGNLRSGRD